MAIDRRGLLAGLAGMTLVPVYGRALAGNRPAYVSARRDTAGYSVAVLDDSGRPLVVERLDGRGHAAAVSADGRKAVMFARRPGRFALEVDLVRGARARAFSSPPDRHFYGHGAFSPDGHLLYASENDFTGERGVLGVYDVAADYRRIGELETYGIGPHEVVLLRDGRRLAVANGGIATHPDYPRRKLNIATMTPSLVYIDRIKGDLLDKASLPPALHQLSIRHLSESGDGTLWWGGQYNGPPAELAPLVGTHRPFTSMTTLDAPEHVWRSLKQYTSAVAASADGARIAVTSSHGGRVLIWDAQARRLIEDYAIEDVSGVAARGEEIFASDGRGRLWSGVRQLTRDDCIAWDNHLVAVPSRKPRRI